MTGEEREGLFFLVFFCLLPWMLCIFMPIWYWESWEKFEAEKREEGAEMAFRSVCRQLGYNLAVHKKELDSYFCLDENRALLIASKNEWKNIY